MKLYPYQKDCIDTILREFKSSNSQLIQLPTGSGKTVIFLHFIKEHADRALILVPTLELIEQIQESGDEILFSGAVRRHYSSTHTVQTFHSLACSKGSFALEHEFDYIIIDEAHHAAANTVSKFLNAYREKYPQTKFIGFTATPERKDKQSLLDIFGKITFQMNILDLVEQGFLCDLRGFRVRTGCVIDNRMQANGDFKPLELRKLFSEDRDRLILNSFIQKCKNKKTIAFCLNIDHSIALAKRFSDAGFTAEFIHGGMSLKDRKDVIERFRLGQTQILTNCQVLTEGFDEPSIEAMLLARPTKSKALYCQMLGRGLRIHKGKKDCIVIDFSDECINVCDFNVSVYDDYSNFDYPNGVGLKELASLHADRQKKTLQNPETASLVEYDPLRLKDFSIPPVFSQTNDLKRLGIQVFPDINFKEAAFLLWMHNLKVDLGLHHQTR